MDQLGSGPTEGAIVRCAVHTAYNYRVFGLDESENTVNKLGHTFAEENSLSHGIESTAML